MSVEQMRTRMAGASDWMATRPFGHLSLRCVACQRLYLQIEAWALALDMANAAASDQRIRDSVAWA